MDDLVLRHIYESNALEGLGPSIKDTYEIVMSRKDRSVADILEERTLQESFSHEPKFAEVAGLQDAFTFALELAHSGGLIREIDVRNLHSLITSHETYAGEYKTVEVEIGGSSHTPTKTYDVEREVRDLVVWLNESHLPPLLLATVSHAWLTHIHPFRDGNGRTARILANLFLARNGYPPLIIKSQSDKGEYLEALAHSDEAGDILVFFDLVVKAINRAAYELESPERVRELIQRDLFAGDYDEYKMWTALLAAFSAQLSEKLTQRGLRLNVVGGLEASDFTLLRARSSAGNGWYAKARSSDGTTDLLIWFGYSSPDTMSTGYLDSVMPSLFFSERDRRPLVEHPYMRLGGSGRLGLDEVTLLPGRKLCGVLRHGFQGQRATLDETVSAIADSIEDYHARARGAA